MYRRFRRILVPGVFCISLAVASGCDAGLNRETGRAQQQYRGQLENTPAPEPVWHVKSVPEGLRAPTQDRADIQLLAIGNQKYVPLRELTAQLELNTEWDASTQTLHMGDNDFPYSITVHVSQAVKNGEAIVLAEAPILYEGSVHLPVSATIDLLHDEMVFEASGDRLVLYPSAVRARALDDPKEGAAEDDGLDFAEDPNDPFRHAEEAVPNEGAGLPSTASGEMEVKQAAANAAPDPDSEPEAVAAGAFVKKVDIDALITKGKQYVGVKYWFGAAPYPKTGRFDCSTFTRYVFGKYGIALPRLARQQAAQGQSVSRKSLRRGDLLFFYVPGRFKSNRTIGHVGIYIGSNQMLHASPKPKNGVQITNINQAYWKDTFLFAKRVVE